MRRLIPVLSLVAVLAACSSQPPAPEQTGAPVTDRNPNDVKTPPVVNNPPDEFGANVLRGAKGPLATREIYFDLDSYAIREEFKPVVAAHARHLNEFPKAKIMVQGNADDRGSREYNLALGQKRAEAVKKALQLLGAREEQVEATSYGEEKQRCSEATDECWAKNRRDDIVYGHEIQ